MRSFASVLGQKGLHLKTFQKKQHRVLDAFISAAEDILKESAAAVKAHLQETEGDTEDGIRDITVSFDGSWHKRGHTSLYGIGVVVEITTGLVLDYVVLSKYCHACVIHEAQLGAGTEDFDEWFRGHQAQCAKNYEGSSNAMEVEAACRLWSRSLEKHGLRYTGFLGDGDSKAYDSVVSLDVYHGIPVEREECVNHAHKRMGTALLNLTKQQKLGGRGIGRLTKDKAMYFQRMYRRAIVRNVDDVDGMRSAIWAALFHCMSSDEAPHHTRCPPGEDTWCFFQRAEALGEEPAPHKDNIHHALDYSVAEAMVPVYQRMSDPNLLKRLAKGKTQNNNECLHSVVWSRCPKTVFVSAHKVAGAVAGAVSSFNAGARSLTRVMEELNIEPNEVLNAHLEHLDTRRVQQARDNNRYGVKLARIERQNEQRRERAAQIREEEPMYGPGIDMEQWTVSIQY